MTPQKTTEAATENTDNSTDGKMAAFTETTKATTTSQLPERDTEYNPDMCSVPAPVLTRVYERRL